MDHLLNIVKELKNSEIANLKHSYGNESDKVSFAHDAAYCESKDIVVKTIFGQQI